MEWMAAIYVDRYNGYIEREHIHAKNSKEISKKLIDEIIDLGLDKPENISDGMLWDIAIACKNGDRRYAIRFAHESMDKTRKELEWCIKKLREKVE